MKPSEVTTLHLTWILRCFMISIFAIILVGCSNSKSQNGNSSQSEEEQTFEDPTNNVHPVIVVCNAYGKDNFLRYHIAFKSNGEYITFDNDADYQSLCAPMVFLIRAIRTAIWSRSDFGYEPGKWLDSAEFDSLLESLPELVNLYLSGKKNEIQDKRVYKIIDSAWYDIHPDRMYFTLSNDRYGHKNYSLVCDTKECICNFFCQERVSYLEDLKGNEVPLDALIFNASIMF